MAESQPVGAPGVPPKLSLLVDSDSEPENAPSKDTTQPTEASSATAVKRKKKSKKLKSILTGDSESSKPSTSDNAKSAGSRMTPQMIDSLLEMNPSLRGELGSMDKSQAAEVLRKMDASQLLTGLSLGGKNQKDMASYKFWQTQPVRHFDEKADEIKEDGPIREVVPEKIPQNAAPLPEGYEWCELDMTKDEEIQETYQLLSNHYVEDDNAMFRFNYSQSFLNWALKSPGWKPQWHIGVRTAKSGLLVASIFAIPIELRVRKNAFPVSEVNFLCIHKKLRSKRLTPVLIKEITRRCHLEGVYQGVHTGGVILPTPVSSCRYYHRSLEWLKLYEVGFSPLPPSSTKARMISRNQLPNHTSTPGLRPMIARDIDSVLDLLSRYLKRFDLAQEFSREEIEHWFISKEKNEDDRVVWAYVVEGEGGKITDLFSFYCLESSVIDNEKHEKVRAAYLFYYASETAFADKEQGFRERLHSLIGDALVEAKKVGGNDFLTSLSTNTNPCLIGKI